MGPLGGGFGNGGWETNTLVSDTTTVICLDDYHANDRGGRKITGTHDHPTAQTQPLRRKAVDREERPPPFCQRDSEISMSHDDGADLSV